MRLLYDSQCLTITSFPSKEKCQKVNALMTVAVSKFESRFSSQFKSSQPLSQF